MLSELQNMPKRTEELEKTPSDSFETLFIPSFMKKFTVFTSFKEMLVAGGFEVSCEEDFQNIPDDLFDEHIANHTFFDDWQEMLDTAMQEYVARKLDF
ncbi:hypothetical protein [Cohnella silvisoli]|uniref:YozE SAM-like domain-containing protein n=1 Tax=Cohnella silvisoli TaxID=2873699 RepID=A0ABV1KY30_9BACL|nr:hypothetical protein [Cohnella silvisoli]MCD9021941.1 hypothetical protein [Cohnella silvisoli]